MERDAKKLKVDEGAEEEQSDEQMDAVGIGGMKWKAEDNKEKAMDCVCENANDVNIVEQDDMLEECNADDCMEKTIQNCADMTEEEYAEQKTFYDDLTGKALKHEKMIDAKLDETNAWQDMGVWEVVPVLSA